MFLENLGVFLYRLIKGQCALVDEYADGELSPEQRARFERHLSRCLECRLAVEWARKLDELGRRYVASRRDGAE